MGKQYGTLSEPLVVENTPLTLDAPSKTGKFAIVFGLIIATAFCIATFAMVCVATEYSKELVVVNSALVDKKTQQVVSTREHEEEIVDPIKGAAGVKFLTFESKDGSITRAEIMAFEKVKCNAQTKSVHCVEGSHYFFKTILGIYAAEPVINSDFEASYTFTPVEDSFYESTKASDKSSKSDNMVGSGYHKKSDPLF